MPMQRRHDLYQASFTPTGGWDREEGERKNIRSRTTAFVPLVNGPRDRVLRGAPYAGVCAVFTDERSATPAPPSRRPVRRGSSVRAGTARVARSLWSPAGSVRRHTCQATSYVSGQSAPQRPPCTPHVALRRPEDETAAGTRTLPIDPPDAAARGPPTSYGSPPFAG